MSSRTENREPMALDESGHGDLLQDAWEVSQKMLKELKIRVGEVGPAWIERRILIVLGVRRKCELSHLFSAIRGRNHLEGLSDPEISGVLDDLIDSGQVIVEDQNGTYYFSASPRS